MTAAAIQYNNKLIMIAMATIQNPVKVYSACMHASRYVTTQYSYL